MVCWAVVNSPVLGQALIRGGHLQDGPTGKATNFTNVWALSIGVSEYEKYDPRLRFAHRDAEYFHDFVRTAYRQPTDKDEDQKFTLLTERNATRKNVGAWLDKVQERVGENDLVVIYFAGHGFVGSSAEPGYLLLYGSEKGKENYSEADRLSLYDLNTKLLLFSQRKAKVLLVLDACHAGNAQDDVEKRRVYSKVMGEKAGAIFSILACQGNEVAYESQAYADGHGIFTWLLVRGLAGEAEKGDGDGVITYTELSEYLISHINETFRAEHKKATEAGQKDVLKRQTPVINGSMDIVFPVDADRFRRFRVASEAAAQATEQALNTDQQRLYQQLRHALQRKEYLTPVGKSVVDLFKTLYEKSDNKDLLAPIYREWQLTFIDEAQVAIDAYYKEAQIGTWQQYEHGANLLAACLTYPEYVRADQLDKLRARQTFLTAYAKFSQYVSDKSTLSSADQQTLFRDLIRQVAADTARSDQPAALHNVLGILWYEVGDTTRARIAYNRARVLAPSWVMPLNNLANLIIDPKQKIAGYEQALKNNPKFFISLKNIVIEYRNAHEFDKAIEYLEKAKVAARTTTEKADVFREYGLIYSEKAKTDSTQYGKAIEAYKQAINAAADPAYVRQYTIDWSLAWLLVEVGQYEQAATYMDAYMVGALPDLKGEPAKAKAAYEDLLKRLLAEPDKLNGYAYYAIGLCHENGHGVPKSKTEAQRWYTFAANLNFKPVLGKLRQAGMKQPTIDRLARNIKLGIKQYPISGLFPDGTKKRILYVFGEYPADTSQVSAQESDRFLAAFGAKIAPEVTDGFQKLYRIAAQYKVSYIDICLYALDPKTTAQSPSVATQQAVEANERTAAAFMNTNRTDSVTYYTNQAVLALGVNLSKPAKTAQMLLDSIRRGTRHDGLLYYALGYLYEFKPSGREWSKAEKWYTYAFQANYKPAYFRLLARARQIVSSSAAIWLTDNYNRGVLAYNARCRLADGTFRLVTVFLQDFPQTISSPIQEESQRLLDVYGATLTDTDRNTFTRLFTEAGQQKKSFIELCRQQLARQNTTTKQTEVEKLVAKGDTLFDQQKYADAAALYRKAATRKDNSDVNERAWAYVRLGVALRLGKQLAPALDAYLTSIALNPRADAYYGLSLTYQSLKKTDKALEAMRQATALRPNEARYQRELGSIYIDLKNYELALEAYRKSLDTEPRNSEAVLKSGLALYELARYDEALVAFDKGIELNPSATVLYQYYKGRTYYKQSEWTKAADMFRQVLTILPNDGDVLNSMGLSLIYLKRYDEGLTYLRRGIEVAPLSAGMFTYNIACSYALQGKKAEALRYLEETIGKYKYSDAAQIKADADFNRIKDSAEFKALLNKYFAQ